MVRLYSLLRLVNYPVRSFLNFSYRTLTSEHLPWLYFTESFLSTTRVSRLRFSRRPPGRFFMVVLVGSEALRRAVTTEAHERPYNPGTNLVGSILFLHHPTMVPSMLQWWSQFHRAIR